MQLFKRRNIEKQAHKNLAKFNEENNDFSAAFEQAHYDDVQDWNNRITESRIKSKRCKGDEQTLKALYESKKLIDSFFKWCSRYKYGDLYAHEYYDVMYQKILREISKLESK